MTEEFKAEVRAEIQELRKSVDRIEKLLQRVVENTRQTNKDVHTEHCCSNCGCKYGEETCSVKGGFKTQSFECGELGICQGW